jgi:hypothetical protein
MGFERNKGVMNEINILHWTNFGNVKTNVVHISTKFTTDFQKPWKALGGAAG